jgi:Xaa-Pro aminopeptidase
MALDIAAIQAALAADDLDGWLLYDFRGSNPIAVGLAGLAGVHTTRRWFYFIPRAGAPRKLVHAIEAGTLAALPGDTWRYAGRRELEAGVGRLIDGVRRIAMEYSPAGAIPYLSRVDAGTIEFVRGFGVGIVSSGDLVGQFVAAWDDAAIASHRAASRTLYKIKDAAFDYASARLSAGEPVHESEIQQAMVRWFADEGLVADAAPIVAVQEHAGNPHYSPTPEGSRALRPGDLLLLDLWGKLEDPGAVYADITWVGVAGDAPADVRRAFDAALAARDAAVALVQSRVAAGQPVRGWEVDRAARDVMAGAGYAEAFVHRTGHSLGTEVHGDGVHMDDYETHDDRRLVPGTGFTIEPGIYTPRFGVRTEINMVVGLASAEVTGPRQTELVRLPAAGSGTAS